MYSTSTTVTYIRKRWVVEPRSECVFEILQQPREGSTPDSVQTTDIGQTTYLCGTFLESFVHVLDHASSGSVFNSINWGEDSELPSGRMLIREIISLEISFTASGSRRLYPCWDRKAIAWYCTLSGKY